MHSDDGLPFIRITTVLNSMMYPLMVKFVGSVHEQTSVYILLKFTLIINTHDTIAIYQVLEEISGIKKYI